MRYYLNTATQEKNYNEYGKKETKGTGDTAKTNAISDLHAGYATMLKNDAIQYWVGKVEDTKGNVLDKCECGEYVEQPAPEPTPETEG